MGFLLRLWAKLAVVLGYCPSREDVAVALAILGTREHGLKMVGWREPDGSFTAQSTNYRLLDGVCPMTEWRVKEGEG